MRGRWEVLESAKVIHQRQASASPAFERFLAGDFFSLETALLWQSASFYGGVFLGQIQLAHIVSILREKKNLVQESGIGGGWRRNRERTGAIHRCRKKA